MPEQSAAVTAHDARVKASHESVALRNELAELETTFEFLEGELHEKENSEAAAKQEVEVWRSRAMVMQLEAILKKSKFVFSANACSRMVIGGEAGVSATHQRAKFVSDYSAAAVRAGSDRVPEGFVAGGDPSRGAERGVEA